MKIFDLDLDTIRKQYFKLENLLDSELNINFQLVYKNKN